MTEATAPKISRWGIARQVTRAMRGSWNCTQVMAQTRTASSDQLEIAGWPVYHQVLTEEDRPYLEALHEAACTGADHYPYLYGVITCPATTGGRDRLHAYLEPPGRPWSELEVARPRDWYDILYQVTVGAEYDRVVIGHTAPTPLGGLYWTRLESVRRTDYTLPAEGEAEEQILPIYHGHRILRWSSSPRPAPADLVTQTARELLQALQGVAVPPTPRALSYLGSLAEGMPLGQALRRWYVKSGV